MPTEQEYQATIRILEAANMQLRARLRVEGEVQTKEQFVKQVAPQQV